MTTLEALNHLASLSFDHCEVVSVSDDNLIVTVTEDDSPDLCTMPTHLFLDQMQSSFSARTPRSASGVSYHCPECAEVECSFHREQDQ